MTCHEAFWVVTGTAGAVLVVASVVTLEAGFRHDVPILGRRSLEVFERWSRTIDRFVDELSQPAERRTGMNARLRIATTAMLPALNAVMFVPLRGFAASAIWAWRSIIGLLSVIAEGILLIASLQSLASERDTAHPDTITTYLGLIVAGLVVLTVAPRVAEEWHNFGLALRRLDDEKRTEPPSSTGNRTHHTQ